MAVLYLVALLSFLAGIGCLPRVDLVLVIDHSRSIGTRNLELTFEFIPRLLEYYSISRSNTRVALVTFSSKTRLEFLLHSYGSRECVTRALSQVKGRVKPLGSSDGVRDAMGISTKIFQRHGRKNASRYIILFTTGITLSNTSKRYLLKLRRKLKALRVQLRTIGFGLVSGKLRVVNGLALKGRRDIKSVLVKWFNHQKKFTLCHGRHYQYDECQRRCICRRGKLTSCSRIRKEFTTFTERERRRYIKAFKEVSLSKQYRTRYEAMTKVHKEYFWKGIHKKKQLLPWHRWYLLQFENLLREIDCRITIPFWDWSYWSGVAWNTTMHIWADDYLGGNGNPLKGFCVEAGAFSKEKWQTATYEDSQAIFNQTKDKLNKGLTCKSLNPSPRCLRRYFNGRPPPFSVVTAAISLPVKDFERFEIITRNYFHSNVHCTVGGTMCTIFASSAPEFWLHHAMLDYIWYRWQRRSRDHRDVYFAKLRSTLISYKRTTKELVNSRNLPGCVSIKYKLFKSKLAIPPKGDSFQNDKRNIDLYTSQCSKQRILFPVTEEEAEIMKTLDKELLCSV